jgi:integrase
MAGRSKKRAHGEGTITQRPDGTWTGQISLGYKADGKRNRPTVYGKTQKEVREKLFELKQQTATGMLSSSKLTVKAYLQRWMPEKARTLEPRSIRDYTYNIEKYILPRIGGTKLAKLTPLAVQNMVGDIDDKAGTRTANYCRAILSGALLQALKVIKREMTIWSTEEAARFLDIIEDHRLYGLFYFVMATGLRHGEVLAVMWDDLKGNVLFVKKSKSKKGVRKVPLSPSVLTVLEQHRSRQEAEAAYLGKAWPGKNLMFMSVVGTKLGQRSVTRTWHNLQDKAQVPRARMHDLRHLHISLLVKEGVDPSTIADRVGHARASFTLDVYTHLFEEQRLAAAIDLDDMLGRHKSPDAPK